MARLVIRNLAELKSFQTKIKVLKAAYPFIQKRAAINYANDTVLDEIHKKMRLNNFSPKIIKATFVGNIEAIGDKIRIHFISNYVAPENDFDVSEAREEGTKSGITRRPKKPGGVLRWIGKAGEVIFRKKSTPKGIERLLIIEKTIKQNENMAAEGMGDEIAKEAKKILGV